MSFSRPEEMFMIQEEGQDIGYMFYVFIDINDARGVSVHSTNQYMDWLNYMEMEMILRLKMPSAVSVSSRPPSHNHIDI